MNTYRSAVVRTPAGPDSLEIIDLPVREPGPGQVRVAIAAAAVNPVDLAVAQGVFHANGIITTADPVGLGWEFAGTVTAAGPGVTVPVGTRVAGLVAGFEHPSGAYAEQIVVDAADIAALPDDLDPVTAAAVPLNALTAAAILDLLGPAPAGGRLLVTGAAGAVGGYLLVLAPERGWVVTGLARPSDEEFVRGLGADFTTHAEPGWDAVADAAVLQDKALALVRDGGVLVGVQPGNTPPAERGVRVTAVQVTPDGAALATLLARTAAGELPARVHTTLPLEHVADAHRAVGAGGVRGRYVLVP